MGANDIKVVIGTVNQTAPGLADAERDVRGSAGRMRRGVEREFTGKGFKEIFSKAMQGDLSGALDDIQEKMSGKAGRTGVNIGMKLVGGITAAIAGWKAGKQLDELLGISDKVGGWIGNAMTKQEGPTAAQQAIKDERLGREAFENTMRKASEALARSQAIELDAEIAKRREAVEGIKDQRDAVEDLAATLGNEAKMWGDVAAMQEQAANARGRADDRNVDRAAINDERAANQLNKRRGRRLAIAESDFARISGVAFDSLTPDQALDKLGKMKTMPRWEKAQLEADIRGRLANDAAAQLEGRRKAVEDAQMQSRDYLKQIKAAQDQIQKMEAELLQIGAAAGGG